MAINQADQVWALDTTYILMAKEFVYLIAVINWASRKVLAAKITITLEACHAVDVQEAFNHHGTPGIVNTDQGSQFTGDEFVKAVADQGCRLSMDGRAACWRDNVFVERLWNSVKCEWVYLHAYDSVNEARKSIMQYLDGNRSRPHSKLEGKSPDEAYAVMLPTVKLAA